jgi:hypothetical protein
MTHPGNGSHVAQWSEKDRDVLTITGPAGNLVESLRVEQVWDRPGSRILWRTGWIAYPGYGMAGRTSRPVDAGRLPGHGNGA